MNLDDQAFLDQIEQNIRSKKDEVDSARKEAEQRALEMERIRKASANLPGSKAKSDFAPVAQAPTVKKNPLADDPRYKEYFARLNKQKGINDEPAPSAPVASASPKKESSVVGPGAIVRFDDGSIGVYKDAVSGRDYALFYFLQPDQQFVPQGVFLQCYQAKVIGNLPEAHFAVLRDRSEWVRDLIVFHLNQYEHVSYLDSLSEHEERKPRNTTPVRNETVASGAVNDITPRPQESSAEDVRPAVTEEKPVETNSKAPDAEADGLVKGRQFKIKFGGKIWEAVFWVEDEQGGIVAHKTHGDWALMRLDLNRFTDSLELGEIVDSATMDKIAESAFSV